MSGCNLPENPASGVFEHHSDRVAYTSGADREVAACVRRVENEVEEDLHEMVGRHAHRRQIRVHYAVHLHAPDHGIMASEVHRGVHEILDRGPA